MFISHAEFSLLKSGYQMRLLRSSLDHTAATSQPAEVLVSGTPETITSLAGALSYFTHSRWTLLLRNTIAHPGVPCALRRRVGAALAQPWTQQPPADLEELAPILAAGVELGAAARQAVSRAVLDLLSGCDEVPVRVTCEPEDPDLGSSVVYANRWLREQATDAAIDALLDPVGELDVVAEDLQFTLREDNEWLEELLEEYWVAMRVNTDDLDAWLRHHRPDLSGDML